MLFPAVAGALGWGIRGQYGHETGAMIPGLLVGAVLALLFCPVSNAFDTVRAVAWGTLAMGVGGSMTYGQTIGLTQEGPLIGNWAAFTWGMLGLAIKGGIWIGFAGAFLGMGLSGLRFKWAELALLLLAMLAACVIGVWLLNAPYDPAHEILPPIYFSADWRWLSDAELKPRREVWGGLLLAFSALVAYLRWGRHDPLAPRLAAWGLVGGAVGFPVGQSVQAFAVWNRAWLQAGWIGEWFPLINWWNFMETVFGGVMGAVLGLGLWRNRHRIGLSPRLAHPAGAADQPLEVSLSPVVEGLLLATHIGLLAGVEFARIPWVDWLYDFGLMLIFIPIVAVAGGRWWPYWVILPLVTLPIAGKTVLQVVYRDAAIAPAPGWLIYLAVPLAVTVAASVWISRRGWLRRPARDVLRPVLLLVTWLFFGLNLAMFEYPRPWVEWTMRTPNAILFGICAAVLTWLTVRGTVDREQRAVP